MKYKTIVLIFGLIFTFTGCNGGGGGGVSCTGSSDTACIDAEYCKATELACGSGGECEVIPETCPADISPVCTCDGITFFNDCYAAQAGQSVASIGECA